MRDSTLALYHSIVTAYKTEKRLTHIQRSLRVANKTVKKALKWAGIEQVDVIKAGLVSRKYPVDHSYFNQIDTAEKAYYLGLLYADGTVIIRDDGQMGFCISLTEGDSYILNALNQRVRYGKPMTTYEYKDGRGRPATHLWVWSKPITGDLIRHGCGPRKSLTLEFPEPGRYFDVALMGVFLRGYFDGDGHAGFYCPRLDVRITSSHAFCRGLRDYLVSRGISASVMDRGVYADTVLTQKLGKMQLYRLLYDDVSFPVCLERKRRAFEGVFEHLEGYSQTKKLNAKQQAILALGRVDWPKAA